MQPAKPWAASKNAALASVISTPRCSSPAGICSGARRRLALVEQRHGAPRPHGPVAKKPPDDTALDHSSVDGEPEWRHEVGDDGIVVSRVERDVVAPGIDDRPDDVEGLIAVERRNLDGDDGGYLGKSAPERVRQRPAAHRRLQVEADERDAGADGRAVRHEPSSSASAIAARLRSPAW